MEPCVFTRKKINIIIINLSKVNAGEMEKYSNVTLGMNMFLILPRFTPTSHLLDSTARHRLGWNVVKVILAVCHNWRPSQHIFLILDSQPWKSSSSRQLYVCLITDRQRKCLKKSSLSLMYPPLPFTHFLNLNKYIYLCSGDCPVPSPPRPAAAATLLVGQGWIKWEGGAALEGVVDKRETRWFSVVCESGGVVALSVEGSVGALS